jgi:hypothetical protein
MAELRNLSTIRTPLIPHLTAQTGGREVPSVPPSLPRMLSRIGLVLLLGGAPAFAITYPPISSFLYGNTGVNAPPEKSFVSGPGYPFRLLLPPNFDAKRKYPVIIFLHGGGEVGTDNERQLTAGRNSANGGLALVSIAEPNNQADFPCIFVAPQMPVNNWYNAASVQAIKDLLVLLKTQYADAIDADRICLTGLSSGGIGTWNIPPQIDPNPFSCLVPLTGFSRYLEGTPKLPIWNFHAANDPTESIYFGNPRGMRVAGEHGSDVIVPHLRSLGYSVIYTRYRTGGHNVWIQSYQNPLLLPWMFAQKRGQFAASTPGLAIEGSLVEGNTLTLWGRSTAAANFSRIGWSIPTIKPSAVKDDGVSDGTATFISASSTFDKIHIGQRLGIISRNPDQGIAFYDIVSVENPTTVTLSANVAAGTSSFMTYPRGTMENPFPATGPVSPQWRLEKIPLSPEIQQVQVVGEFPSGVATYGGLATMNLAFTLQPSAPATPK